MRGGVSGRRVEPGRAVRGGRPAARPAADIDHLVYATPDLADGVATIERLLGAAATAGGHHRGLGTRNALVSLGPSSYLEIIGPDPEQPAPARARPFGIDALAAARLATWAVRRTDLEHAAAAARSAGVDLGGISPMSRSRPDGSTLSWRLTDVDAGRADGVIPFLIDWLDSPHPAAGLPPGCTLVSLHAVHPRATTVRRQLEALGIELRVEAGADVGLIAMLHGPRGLVALA